MQPSPADVSTHTTTGAVAVTPHHLATETAVRVMADGGTAVDALVAANAVLGMVLPTTCGIGGDLFAMVHRPGMDRPDVLNASGRAGEGADAARLRAAGHTTLDLRSGDTVTVPGCVDGWGALLGRHGTRPLADLLAPAIALGEDGFEVSAELSSDLGRIEGFVAHQAGAASLYPDGSVPAPGAMITRRDLADTLSGIAGDGRDAFYQGPVAAAITEATDGILTADDLATNHPDWVEAIGARVFGLDGWTVPPNSQGYLTIAAALLLEALDPPNDPEDPGFHHAVIEAYRAVAWERDDLVADPDHAPLEAAELLDPQRILDRLSRLSADRVTRWPAPDPAPGGTAYFCAVDADGMAVSMIQSNFTGIGSGIVAGTTGVFLQNRGGGFNLTPGHPNEVAPGKRPLHTLSPTLWTREGSPAMVLGTRGGHKQPQYLVQMVARLFTGAMGLREAQAAPRWHADTVDPLGSAIAVEVGMPESVVVGLVERGHTVDRRPDAPAGWGPISVVTIDDTGTRRAAADPRVSTAGADGD
ncbi:MAG TPA: gamma-glutamyltransferase [Acidimicrobiia bacterium]|nr:gamma-glutamyltransferase [Acidimicrobiia bacterium]